MKGILRGAIGGLGRGMSENANRRMDYDDKVGMTRGLAEMEAEIQAQRQQAIMARRQAIMGSAADPEELRRNAALYGDKEVYSYANDTLDREAAAEKAERENERWERTYAQNERKINRTGASKGPADPADLRLQQEQIQLKGAVDGGVATPEQVQRLQAIDTYFDGKASSGYKPASAKNRAYWSNAPAEEVAAEAKKLFPSVKRKNAEALMDSSDEEVWAEVLHEVAASDRDDVKRALGLSVSKASAPTQRDWTKYLGS